MNCLAAGTNRFRAMQIEDIIRNASECKSLHLHILIIELLKELRKIFNGPRVPNFCRYNMLMAAL